MDKFLELIKSGKAGKLLPVYTWPHKILQQPAKPVTDFNDEELSTIIIDMLLTLTAHNALGIAGPQVGIDKQIIVIHIPYDENDKPIYLINPKITEQSVELFEMDEGCLSVPGYYEKGVRPKEITVEYFNEFGKKKTEKFVDKHAFVIQHEIDHLNGKVFIEHLSDFKKQRIKKKINKIKRQLNKQLKTKIFI